MPNKSLFLNYIDEQNIRVINFNEFVNVSKVGKSGKVKKANSTTFGIIALKRLNLGSNLDENDYRDLSIKIKHLCDIKPHPNINQIYGFTKENSNKGASLSDSENYPTFNHYPFERSTSLPDDFIDLDSYIIEPEHLVYISKRFNVLEISALLRLLFQDSVNLYLYILDLINASNIKPKTTENGALIFETRAFYLHKN
ncbi:11179_t:CDS:2 [Gigaspora rosea]|nr:11179_t:CDS:2 [Gigaspora rosea]